MSNRHKSNVVPGGDVALSDLPDENLSVHLIPQHREGVHLDNLEGGSMQDHEAAGRNRHAERACREVGDCLRPGIENFGKTSCGKSAFIP